jgi:hypothetical protein
VKREVIPSPTPIYDINTERMNTNYYSDNNDDDDDDELDTSNTSYYIDILMWFGNNMP